MRTFEEIQGTLDENPEIFEGLDDVAVKKFLIWYPTNLHVLSRFEKEALFLKRHGNRERYSAYTIREKLRWDSLLKQNPNDYKLDNNYSPMIARILMLINEELAGMFTTRKHFPDPVTLFPPECA